MTEKPKIDRMNHRQLRHALMRVRTILAGERLRYQRAVKSRELERASEHDLGVELRESAALAARIELELYRGYALEPLEPCPNREHDHPERINNCGTCAPLWGFVEKQEIANPLHFRHVLPNEAPSCTPVDVKLLCFEPASETTRWTVDEQTFRAEQHPCDGCALELESRARRAGPYTLP